MSEVTLREHLEALVRELDVRVDMRLRDLDLRLTQRFDAQRQALDAAFAAAAKGEASNKELIAMNDVAAEKWRHSANEWRGAMIDREARFMTRNEYDLAHHSLVGKVEAVERIVIRSQGEGKGMSRLWAIAVAVAVSVGSLVAIAHTLSLH